jgi:hypothetical protein
MTAGDRAIRQRPAFGRQVVHSGITAVVLWALWVDVFFFFGACAHIERDITLHEIYERVPSFSDLVEVLAGVLLYSTWTVWMAALLWLPLLAIYFFARIDFRPWPPGRWTCGAAMGGILLGLLWVRLTWDACLIGGTAGVAGGYLADGVRKFRQRRRRA